MKAFKQQLNRQLDTSKMRYITCPYDDDDDDDVYLYKLQTRVSKNLYEMFPYRPAKKNEI